MKLSLTFLLSCRLPAFRLILRLFSHPAPLGNSLALSPSASNKLWHLNMLWSKQRKPLVSVHSVACPVFLETKWASAHCPSN